MEKIVHGAEGRPTEPRAAIRCVKKKKRKKDLELLRRQVLEAKRNSRKEAAPSKVRKTSLTRALNYFADQRQENDKKTRGVDRTGKKVGKRKICTKLLSLNEQRIGIFAKGSKGDRIKRENQNSSEENRARLRGEIHRLMNGINSNWSPPADNNKSPILGNINQPKRHSRGDELRTRKHTKKKEFQDLDHIDLAAAEVPPPRTQKENRYKRRLFEDDVDDNFGKMDRFLAEELRFSPKIMSSGISTTNGTPENNASDREITNQSENTKIPFFALRNANWSPTRRYDRLCTMICSEKFENCLEEIQYRDPLKKAKRTLMGIYADSCRQHLLRQRSNAYNGLENSSTSSSLSETEDQVDITEDTDALSSAEDSDVLSEPEKKHARIGRKEKDWLAAAQARTTNHADRRLSQISESESESLDNSREPFHWLDANKRKGVKGCKRNTRKVFAQDSHEGNEKLSMASLRVNIDAKSWNIVDRPKSDVIPFGNMSNVVKREAFMIKFLENLNMNKAKKDTLKLSPQEAYWSSPRMRKFLEAQSLDDSISRRRNNVKYVKDPAVLKFGNYQNVAEFEDLPRKIRFPRTTKYVPAILRRPKTRKSTEQADISDPLFPFRVNVDKATETDPHDEDTRKKNKYEMEAAPSFAIPKMQDLTQSRMTTDISFSEFETHLQTPSIVNAYLEHKNGLMKSKVNFMNAKYRTVSRDIYEDNERQGYSRNEERNCVQQAECGFDPKNTKGNILQQSSKEVAPLLTRNKDIATLQEKYIRELVPHREENPAQGESHKNCAKTVRFLRAEPNGSAEDRASRQRAGNELPRNEGQNCKASNSKCRDARDFGNFTELASENLTRGGMKTDNFHRENQKQPDGLEILRCENGGNQRLNYAAQNAGAQSELQKLVVTSSFDNEDSRDPSNFHACKPADGLVRVIALENQSDTCRRPEFIERAQEATNLCEDVQPAKYLAFDSSQNIQRIPIYIRNDRVGGLASESCSAGLANFTKNRQGEQNAAKNVEHKIVIVPRAEENSGILYAQDTQAPRPLLKDAPGGAFQNSEVTCPGYPVAATKNFYGQTVAPREFSQGGAAAHRILQNVQIIEPLFQNKERNHCYPGVVYQEGDRMVASFMAEPMGITKNNENSRKQFENACSFESGQDSERQSHCTACAHSRGHPNPPKRIQLSNGTVGLLVPRNNSHPNMTQRQESVAGCGVVYTGQNSNFQWVIDPTYQDGGRTRIQTDGNWDRLHQRFVQPVYNIIDAHPSQVSTNKFPTGF
ncbi:uncharacterized protein LOC107263139 isoform X2 [Cephus cinctus]|uniref:Uncharacterized protein LOC107263139 isoform X2 n=1 Tax=Cephus cinctus TaxID=211228 RepID=A0AAJ7FCV9_CEPCN|nr:uncharacterized protein LOC107263139 isoform X2 [Cephus cinctus]